VVVVYYTPVNTVITRESQLLQNQTDFSDIQEAPSLQLSSTYGTHVEQNLSYSQFVRTQR